MRITDTTVECFFNYKRIALHQRAFTPGHTTLLEHMPKAHKDYVQWTPERLQSWALQVGPNTAKLINKVIGLYKIPQQGFRSCFGLLRLGKTYTPQRLEAACMRAIEIGAHSYKSIESILKNGLDQQPLSNASHANHKTHIPSDH